MNGFGFPSVHDRLGSARLPELPVFSFVAASLQPQNRQIMSELEC